MGSWTLGRFALALIALAFVLIMCAGYVGEQALLGAAALAGALGFTALVIRVFRR